MSKTLDALLITLPLVQEMVGIDMQLALSDRTKVLGVWQAKNFFLPGAKDGVELSRENPANAEMLDVMETGKASVKVLPKEILGEPIKGILTPVFENGEVVGVVACATSLKEMDMIKTSADHLFSNLSQTQDAVEDIAGGATSIAEKLFIINKASEIVTKQVEQAVECVMAIQNIAYRSNILALNGTIEATRVGEAGRGFTVIAKEMRNFSRISGESANQITDSLKEVSNSIKEITREVSEVNDVAILQAASTQEITASLYNITDQASKLVKTN